MKMKNRDEIQQLLISFFLLAILGCIIGWIYEMLFYRIDLGHFIKRGQGYGPWLPIYGFGALGLTLFSYRRKLSMTSVFLISMFGSGVLELAVGWLLYHLGNGLRLWDYNVEIWNWGNIGGYVCLRSVLLFGLFGTVFYNCAIPGVFALTEKTDRKSLVIMTTMLGIPFVIDIFTGYIVKPFLALLVR